MTGLEVPLPCAAWMVTPVSDNSKRASMEYAAETHSFECMMGDGKTITVEVELPLIKVVDGALAFVNEINGSSYAVLKRGLLLLAWCLVSKFM